MILIKNKHQLNFNILDIITILYLKVLHKILTVVNSKNQMKTVNINGGLGNQLFQYFWEICSW